MEHQASAKKHMINNGILLGVVSVVIGVVMYITDSYPTPHWAYSVVGFAFLIVFIVMAQNAFKKDNGGFISLGQAIKIGLGVALISSIIGVLWTYVLTNFLITDYSELMMAAQREAMLERQPDMSEAQLDAAMEMVQKFSSPFISMAVQVIGGLFFGFIVSLISGLVIKNDDPNA